MGEGEAEDDSEDRADLNASLCSHVHLSGRERKTAALIGGHLEIDDFPNNWVGTNASRLLSLGYCYLLILVWCMRLTQ